MTTTVQTPRYTLGEGEKMVPVMAYTQSAMVWGELVTREIIRVSTWLRTDNAPGRIRLYNARVLSSIGGPQSRPQHFSEVYIATSQINIFHMIPPHKDPPDYDPTEPNRKMEPVILLVSNFRIDGHLRLATSGSVGKFLEVVRENFTSIYEAKISHPNNPSFGVIMVPYVIVRQEATVFTIQ
jgi:hypothetical protein